jgi:hypothetical protein
MESYKSVIQSQLVIRFEGLADLVIDFTDFQHFDNVPSAKLSIENIIPSLMGIWGTISTLVVFNNYLELNFDPKRQIKARKDGDVPSLPLTLKESLPEFAQQAINYLAVNPLALSEEGVGGTYFLHENSGVKFGIFKPIDEEPGSPKNPKNLVSNPLLPPGGGAAREVAAYLLDHGFANVPETYLLENITTVNNGTKTGSIQKFIPNDGESSSVGYSSFLTEDVHRIGTLDIRLFNMDRNGENILIKKEGKTHRLIPIDHAYSLPEKLDGAYFEWMYWPQAKTPFTKETLEFIQSLDISRDSKILRDLGISEASIRTMCLSTLLLKHCASIGKKFV